MAAVNGNTDQYQKQDVGNFNPTFAQNSIQPLMGAIGATNASSYIQSDAGPENGGYQLTNIGFEQQHAKITGHHSSDWLESFQALSDFVQLQHSQSISTDIPISDVGTVGSPHITSNTLTEKNQSCC